MISSKIQLGSPAATDIRKILFDLITYFQTVGVTVYQVLILILASKYVCSLSSICLFYCKKERRSLEAKSDNQNVIGVWHEIDIEIRCKGHCEKLSGFLDLVSHTVSCLYCRKRTCPITL